MAYMPGVPQNPILSFMDGSEFIVLRSARTTSSDGKPAIEFDLAPFGWVKTMLGLKEKELKTDIYEHGYLTRTYPAAKILKISENPEKPVWWAFTTFHGTLAQRRNKEVSAILEIIEENEQLTARNRTLEALNKKLQKDIFEMSIRLSEHFETQKSLMQPRDILPLQEGQEIEYKRKMQGDK